MRSKASLKRIQQRKRKNRRSTEKETTKPAFQKKMSRTHYRQRASPSHAQTGKGRVHRWERPYSTNGMSPHPDAMGAAGTVPNMSAMFRSPENEVPGLENGTFACFAVSPAPLSLVDTFCPPRPSEDIFCPRRPIALTHSPSVVCALRSGAPPSARLTKPAAEITPSHTCPERNSRTSGSQPPSNCSARAGLSAHVVRTHRHRPFDMLHSAKEHEQGNAPTCC